MNDKSNWLKCTRTKNGRDVRKLVSAPDGWITGEYSSRSQWTLLRWYDDTGENGGGVDGYDLDLTSIPTELEPVCACKGEMTQEGTAHGPKWCTESVNTPAKCKRCLGTGEYKDNFSGTYFECDSCASAAVTWGIKTNGLHEPDTGVVADKMREAVQAEVKEHWDAGRKVPTVDDAGEVVWVGPTREGMRKLVEVSEEEGAYGTAEAEWKPGMQVQTPEWDGVAVIVAVADGDAWVRCQEEHAIVALSELRRPAPKTRDVTVWRWEHSSGAIPNVFSDVLPEADCGWWTRREPYTFPGVPVDGGEDE